MVRLPFARVLEKIRMRLLLGRDTYRAVHAAINWIHTIADDSTVVRVEFPRYTGSLLFMFPLRARDLPRRIRKNAGSPTFIIRTPSSLPEGQWTRVFRSPDIEVLERSSSERGLVPIRFGLSHEEKMLALRLVRDVLEEALEKKPTSQRWDVPPRFLLSADVNVALWVGGTIRGSHIVERTSFHDGLLEAARRALADPRFKPVALEKLRLARIQIGILHPLRMPLSKRIFKHNRILPEKGYLLSHNGKKGWFLPEVLNVRRFRGFDELLTDLAREKAGIEAALIRAADVRIFEVEDFIESADRAHAVHLFGPMPALYAVTGTELDERFRAAADWLRRIQEQDGYIPSIVSPFSRHAPSVDWPRLAFSAWALAEYGKTTSEHMYQAAAEKAFVFLRTYLLDTGKMIPSRELSLAYFGRLALSLHYESDARKVATELEGKLSKLPFEPITHAHVAGFLRVVGSRNDSEVEICEQFLKKQFRTAVNKKRPMSLAAWAELVNLFHNTDESFSVEVCKWLMPQQREGGAFPDSTTSEFVYTRGTGKIVEVLALKKEKYKKEINKALAWLFSMQYHHDTMFFIVPEMRSRIFGSFRHDYLNQEAWIDSAGHVLLACARLKAGTQP